MGVLQGLSQDRFFDYFEDISSIPHGSGNMAAIGSYCEEFAKAHGFRYVRDESDNIIIFKQASEGYEDAPSVMLQGHLDMVCEKEQGSSHCFETEPLKLFIDGDEIGAAETTLGADDGIAIAYILAILSDRSLKHPALECVMTTDEETGMNGAEAIDLSMCKAKYLINIDNEKDGRIMAGCAGGVTVTAVLPLKRKLNDENQYSTENQHNKTTKILNSDIEEKRLIISIDGLTGGHSGDEIQRQRANAPRLMARLLLDMKKQGIEFDLVRLTGGNKDNAIPRNAEAEISITCNADKFNERKEIIIQSVRESSEIYNKEFRLSDPHMKIAVTDVVSLADNNVTGVNRTVEKTVLCDSKAVNTSDGGSENYYNGVGAITPECFNGICMLLAAAPDGVQKMSLSMEGLVQTSLNTGVVRTDTDTFEVRYLIRSSIESEKEELKDRLLMIIKAAGAAAKLSGSYPGWEYKAGSELQQIMKHEWTEMTGSEPTVEAIHAGVECGLLLDKMPELDAVSIGPQMRGIHTPQERLSISSSIRYYNYLKRVLSVVK